MRRSLEAERIAPEAFMPERIRAGQQGVFQHIDRRAELLPQSRAERRLHRSFSHNVYSLLLLFSTCSPHKRSEPPLLSTASSSRETLFCLMRLHPPLVSASSGEVSSWPALVRSFTRTDY